jgi:radical SAM family uncharacterized protein
MGGWGNFPGRLYLISLWETVSAELLPHVSQPAQYIGGEINQLVQDGDWERAEVRVAIAFPDAYAIGVSHLGSQILYWLCNHAPGVVAERVYCPRPDAEGRMRARRIPLFTWDTRRPVAEADILGISLQYEMAYSNVLTLLDLAGIPLRSKDRDESHPLVLGGGPQADNPEPMADFFDLIVNGDGEVALAGILELYRQFKRDDVPRDEMIRAFARGFRWIYAPSLYDIRYRDDGMIAAIEPTVDGIAYPVRRCQTPEFETAPIPVRPLVPHVQAVHERISIEIMRGCPQRCRFCHAGYTKRPLRWRSVNRVLEIAEEAYRATGFDEIGLLSLSTSDYPELPALSRQVHEQFADRRVSISLPSLRVDGMLRHVPWMANSVRKSGLTIAIEAARDGMRQAILKKVTDGNLLEGVRAAYEAGWRSVKLYFMAGLPGERPKDIEGIYELSREVSEARRQVCGRPAAVNASVGWLVPKPHTPMQWAAQATAEYFESVRDRLRSLARRGPVRIKTHRIDRSILEAVFARGDRRLSDAIEAAWRAGARFDAWDECFDHAIWDRAFEATGVDKAWYAHRERPADEIFPWSHLAGARQSHDYLRRQYEEGLACITPGS